VHTNELSYEYFIRTWNINSGLPQNTVTSLLQTHEGYIWIGTPSGLARFDGVQFTTFGEWNTAALKSNHISALFEDNNGVLWIGTSGGGLCSYDKGEWKCYNTENGLSNNNVRAICKDWLGNLWVGTEYGLNRLDKDGVQIFTTDDGLHDNIVTALTIDSWGDLWAGTLRGGLAHFKAELIHVFDHHDGLLNNAVLSLYSDHLDKIWIGTLEGLYYLKKKQGVIQNIFGTAYTPVTAIVEDEHGFLWFGTMADGLKKMLVEGFTGYNEQDGFPDDYVRCVLKDSHGTLWIGTDGGGLVQMKKSGILNISKREGLPENNVTAVLQDDTGIFWIATRNSGIAKMINNQIVHIFNKKSGLSDNRIKSLYQDNEDLLWIGTETAGINIIENNNIYKLSSVHGLSCDTITAILQDGRSNMWLGSARGLCRIKYNKKYHSCEKVYLRNNYIRVLLESREGILYIGTKTGIYTLVDDSLSKVPCDRSFDTMALFEDSKGAVWIGTNGSGLKRWFNGRMTGYTTADGLYDNHIFSITEDQNATLWLSSYQGVFKIDRSVLLDTSNQIICTYYNESDGMASRQCSGGNQPAVFRTSAGRLYYPTVNGISIFDPQMIAVNAKNPVPVIEKVLVDNETLSVTDEISLSHSPDILEIGFTAFDYIAPRKLRFSYKLEGQDTRFHNIDPGENRFARYVNLNPGNYRFVITCMNNDGVSSRAISIKLKVPIPLYQKPLFHFIFASIFVMVIITLYRIRYHRKIRKQKEKYKTSTLDPEKTQELLPKLLNLMEKENVFLDPDLTLKDLAKNLSIHYNHLSRLINEHFGLSFNDFINKYRINAVKQKLISPNVKKKTILQIMYECGFYSKSVFNTAFKKFTGMTPKEYRNKNS
jgi:ligand-binding sensor domain-containing protein/AraC-like DNA-binding protein